MGNQGKARFRLTRKDTRKSSEFSPWFDEASLYGGPGMLELDHAIVVCLGECLFLAACRTFEVTPNGHH